MERWVDHEDLQGVRAEIGRQIGGRESEWW